MKVQILLLCRAKERQANTGGAAVAAWTVARKIRGRRDQFLEVSVRLLGEPEPARVAVKDEDA